jgi:chemotaxis protein MotB
MGKKKKQAETPAPDLNQIMTVSLFIILLAFFILLNSIAVEDESRQRLALGSLMENFGVLSGGFSVTGGENQKVSSELIKKVSSLLNFSDLIQSEDDPLNGLVVTTNLKESVITLPAGILFEAGTTRIKASGHPVLDRICRAVNETQYSVTIAGHADSSSGGSMPGVTPRETSSLQALAVLQYFIEAGEVSPDLTTAYGWGEYQPISDSKIREVRSLNQRIEITMVHTKRLEKPEGFFTFKNFFFNVLDQ